MTANLKDFEKSFTLIHQSQSTPSKEKNSYFPRNYRRILCIFPKYSPSFGTFHHAYQLMGHVRAFMPPQGILVVAAYLPKEWEIKFIDENIKPTTKANYQWADIVIVSGMHIQRPQINRINELAHQEEKITVLGGPSVSACPEYYPQFDILHLGELGDATDEMIAYIDKQINRPSQQIRFETKERLPLHNFPIPAYHLLNINQYFYRRAAMELLPHLIEWQQCNGYPVQFACEATLNLAQSPKLLEMMRQVIQFATECSKGEESASFYSQKILQSSITK